MRIFQITLDSCCIDKTGQHRPGVEILRRWYANGWVELVQTSTVRRETEGCPNEERPELERQWHGVPVDTGVGVEGLTSPPWGFQDVDNRYREISRVLFPTTRGLPRQESKVRDVLDIQTHLLNDRDVFVTADQGHILKPRARYRLQRHLGVVVCRALEAVARIQAAWEAGGDPRGMGDGGVLFGTNLVHAGAVICDKEGQAFGFIPWATNRAVLLMPAETAADDRTILRTTGAANHHSERIAVSKKPVGVQTHAFVYELLGAVHGPCGALLVELTFAGVEPADDSVEVHLVKGAVEGRLRLVVGDGLYREVIVLAAGERVLEARVLPKERLWVRGRIHDRGGRLIMESTKSSVRISGRCFRAVAPLDLAARPGPDTDVSTFLDRVVEQPNQDA
jgi:hypothetical protein